MVVIKKEVGKAPEIIEIENELKALQYAVDGYIETLTFSTDAALVFDEEGRIKDKPVNAKLFGIEIVGTILVVGVKDDEFISLKDPDEMMRLIFG